MAKLVSVQPVGPWPWAGPFRWSKEIEQNKNRWEKLGHKFCLIWLLQLLFLLQENMCFIWASFQLACWEGPCMVMSFYWYKVIIFFNRHKIINCVLFTSYRNHFCVLKNICKRSGQVSTTCGKHQTGYDRRFQQHNQAMTCVSPRRKGF